METSLLNLFRGARSGVRYAMHRWHLVQAFPFIDEEIEMRGWGGVGAGGICSQLTECSPTIIFPDLQESGLGGGLGSHFTHEESRTVQWLGALPKVPRALGNPEEALEGG